MEDPQSSLAIASTHFDNGQIKDAYNIFLSTAQNAMKPLFDVKFVHCSIVSKPQNSAALLSILHTCVDHIEKIIEYHSPTTSKIAPPPLPPKPSHVTNTTCSKPVLPPKPTVAAANIPSPITTTMKRSFSVQEPSYTSTPIYQQQHTRSNSISSTTSSVEIADGEIDPTHLVPAQTNNSDSLTPTGGAYGIKTDHIPHIPVPPLLTTHRVLQAKLDELESSLKDYKTRKQQLMRGEEQQFNYQMTENEINEAISKYTPYIAEAKHTLNRVRTLYMSAATIPSILHFSPGLVAYQMTRIESAIFLAIPPLALLSHTAKSPHPRIVASTDFFNYITRLIEHSILLPQEASVRAQHINHWIKIASKCQDLNNYQTLKAIVSALGTPPVQRLKRTWAYIPKKSMARLESMNDLMSESNNYGKYREHMGIVSTSVLNGKSVTLIQSEHYKRPTVPFLGTFIHDMTYLLAAVGQQQQKSEDAFVPVRTSSRQQQFGIQQQQHQDPRINKLLELLQKFQSTPTYDRRPNATNAKMIQKGQNQSTRPSLSQAIHRSKSSFGRLGGAIVGGFSGGNNNNSSTTSVATSHSFDSSTTHDSSYTLSGLSDFDGEGEDFDTEEQQNLVTQYILMRSWVSQNTVDELSLLREPPNIVNTNGNNARGTGISGRSSSTYTSSIMSNTSSLMRINSNSYHSPAASTLTFASSNNSSRPASLDDYFSHAPPYHPGARSYVYGRDSANTTGPLTSSSTLEDNDDDFDDPILTASPHPIMYHNKESNLVAAAVVAGAPVLPPRPK